MSIQLALTLFSTAVGLLASIYFCVGSVLNSSIDVVSQATPRWDFNDSLARSLVTQRAQYIVGALLLFAAFIAQLSAAIASPSELAPIPSWASNWFALVSVTLVCIGFVSIIVFVTLRCILLRKIAALLSELTKTEQASVSNG